MGDGASDMSSKSSKSDSAVSPLTKPTARGRTHHRSAQHDSAHATPHASVPIPHHPLICPDAADLVDTQSALDDLIAALRADGSFAYDSEFIGELSYLPKLCLIQVASHRRIALIDPLSDQVSLDGFWDLLCDPAVEKVVHAGQQDIEPVLRFRQRPPANLFDTQLAAGFCGMTHPSALSRLIHELLDVKIGKGLTFTHWDQRPLSAQQLRYAADDVRYLPALRAALGALLEAEGHTAHAQEEFASLCEPSQYRFDPATYYLRVRGSGNLPADALAVLRELTVWRDGAARAQDVPPRTLLRDEILVDLARSPVKSADKFDRVRGLPRPIEQEYGQAIIEATARGLKVPTSDMPEVRHVEPSPRERFTADAVWAWVQVLCVGRSIDPNLVTNRQEVGDLVRPLLAGEPIPPGPLLTGWRRELIADPLMDIVRNDGSKLELNWGGGKMRTHHLRRSS